jgi:hypothetical protein
MMVSELVLPCDKGKRDSECDSPVEDDDDDEEEEEEEEDDDDDDDDGDDDDVVHDAIAYR